MSPGREGGGEKFHLQLALAAKATVEPDVHKCPNSFAAAVNRNGGGGVTSMSGEETSKGGGHEKQMGCRKFYTALKWRPGQTSHRYRNVGVTQSEGNE